MQTPKTNAGEITEQIMAEVSRRLPSLPTESYNAMWEACLSVMGATELKGAACIQDLSTALRDAISTYGDKPEILVTSERQEAWTAALKRSGI